MRPRLRRGVAALALAAVFAGSHGVASAGQGEVDLDFGRAGVVTGRTPDQVTTLAVDPRSGALAVAGKESIALYSPGGHPKERFGRGGVAEVGAGRTVRISKVLIDERGRLIAGGVVGGRDSTIEIFRLRRDGRPDRTFGNRGTVTTSLVPAKSPDLDLDRLGRIVVASEGAVQRFLPGGAADLTFGGDGTAELPVGVSAAKVAALDDGGVLVAGTGTGVARELVLARFTATGAPDPAFGDLSTGITRAPDPSDPRALALASDGSFYVSGPSCGVSGCSVGTSKFLSAGTPDPSFDRDGAGPYFGSAASVGTDGSLFLGLTRSPTGDGDTTMAITKLKPTGRPVRPFGYAGTAFVRFHRRSEGTDLALTPDGGVVIAGTLTPGRGGHGLAKLDAYGR